MGACLVPACGLIFLHAEFLGVRLTLSFLKFCFIRGKQCTLSIWSILTLFEQGIVLL